MDQPIEEMPATIGDVLDLLMYVLFEVMEQATLTTKAADGSLIEIANNLLETAGKSKNERLRLTLNALAHRLIGTEPGAEICG